MKKLMLTLAAVMLIGTAAMAQDDNKKEKKLDKTEMVKKRTESVATKYKLDENQTKKLLELNTKYADKLNAGPAGGRGMGQRGEGAQAQRKQMTDEQKKQMQERRQQRQADMEAYKAELKKIFNDEQMKQYEADMAQGRNGGPRGGQRGGQKRNTQNNQ